MNSEEKEKALQDIIKACNDFEESQVPSMIALYETVDKLKDDIVLIQLWGEIASLGKGYKESFKKYKGNFQKYKDDVKKLGLKKGHFFKDRIKEIGEGFKNKMLEFKGQIQSLIQSLSTLPACFANPFTITAGFPIFFAVLAQAVNISRALRIVAQFILDYELYKVSDMAEDFPEVKPTFDTFDKSIIIPLTIAAKPFVVLSKLIESITKIVQLLIGPAAWTKLLKKFADVGQILEKAQEIATYYEDLSKNSPDGTYFGHLFEGIEVEVDETDEKGNVIYDQFTGDTKKKIKHYQYVGCNLLVKTGDEDEISCSGGFIKRSDLMGDENPRPGVFKSYISKNNFETFMTNTGNPIYPETDRTKWLNPDNWIDIESI